MSEELSNPEEASTPGADSEEIITRLKGEGNVARQSAAALSAEVKDLKAQIKVLQGKIKTLMSKPRKVERKHSED